MLSPTRQSRRCDRLPIRPRQTVGCGPVLPLADYQDSKNLLGVCDVSASVSKSELECSSVRTTLVRDQQLVSAVRFKVAIESGVGLNARVADRDFSILLLSKGRWVTRQILGVSTLERAFAAASGVKNSRSSIIAEPVACPDLAGLLCVLFNACPKHFSPRKRLSGYASVCVRCVDTHCTNHSGVISVLSDTYLYPGLQRGPSVLR